MSKRTDRAARRKRTQERMKKEGSDSSGSKRYDLDSDVKRYKPEKSKKGEYALLDLVPYRVTAENNPFADVGELVHGRTVFTHYGVGPENDTLHCPKTIGKRCSICEYIAGLDWDEDEKEIKNLRASKRVIYNLIDVEEDPDEILFCEMAYANFGKLLREEFDEADDDNVILGLDFLDDRPTLKVRFKGDKFDNNPFVKASKIDAIQGEDFTEDILDDVTDLDKCLIILSADEIQKIFLGLDDDDTIGGDGREDEPKEEKKTAQRKKSPPIEPKEKESDKDDSGTGDDVPMSPNGGEDEKEEAPPKTGRTRKSKTSEKASEPDEDNKCRAGHVFGVDTDLKDSCSECKSWDDCMDEKERLEG